MTSPVPGHGIGTPYGVPGSWKAGYHTGNDYPAPTGTPVVATRAGKVTKAQWDDDYGNRVEILTGDVEHSYSHLSKFSVSVGQQVAQGQQVGEVGSTGNSTGPHCHYEERLPPHGYSNDRKPQFDTTTGGTPPPPTGGGDDDMTPEQATLLGNIGWAVDQIRSTDLPPIRKNTDRVVHVQDSTDKTEWGVLDEAQGLRTMVADLQRAVARIEEKLDGS